MIRPQADIFVQIIGRHFGKIKHAAMAHGNQLAINGQGRGTRSKAEHAARLIYHLSRNQHRRCNGRKIPVGIDANVHDVTAPLFYL